MNHTTDMQVASSICQNGDLSGVGGTNSPWIFAKLLTTCEDEFCVTLTGLWGAQIFG